MFWGHIYLAEVKRLKRAFCYVFFIFVILYMIIFPQSAISEAKRAVILCGEAILPTLFVFLVCSQFLINTGFAKILKKPFAKIMYPLFGINGSGALCVLAGYISGYPVGAVCTCELYKKGDLKRNEAERLLGFCNNAGPLFIIGSVGTAMLKSRSAGYVLWLSHILASVICGMILRLFSRGKMGNETNDFQSESISLVSAVSESVKNAVEIILNICANTVFFSVVISILFRFAGVSRLSVVLGGMIEMTNAINKMCVLKNYLFSSGAGILPYIAFVLGFGGICVHLQVAGVVRKTDLSLKLYFLGKTMHAFFSFAAAYALTKLIM